MQNGELQNFGKSFLLLSRSCKVDVAGRSSKRKDPGVDLRFGVSALGTGVPGPWWEMSPYEMWQGVGEIRRM